MSRFAYVQDLTAHLRTLSARPQNADGSAAFGGGRLKSYRAAWLKVYMSESSGFRCLMCGKDVVLQNGLDNSMQFGHIIRGGKSDLGWSAGNVFTQCAACNNDPVLKYRNLDILFPRFELPHLLLVSWPAGETKGAKSDIVRERAAIRLERGIV